MWNKLKTTQEQKYLFLRGIKDWQNSYGIFTCRLHKTAFDTLEEPCHECWQSFQASQVELEHSEGSERSGDAKITKT
jgi:hypothetical protein